MMTEKSHLLHDLRRDYDLDALDASDLASDPIEQFRTWFADAQAADIIEPNAMTLATADREGTPDARIVLLKEIRSDGFVFYSNYDSAKGMQLSATPKSAIVFYWDVLQRQVRVQGAVERISADQSTAYFRQRPRKSQIAAIASPQSRVIPDRATLEDAFAAAAASLDPDTDLPRPESWGGYIVVPEVVEFWQGRRSRLHDRLRYRRHDDGWEIERLAP